MSKPAQYINVLLAEGKSCQLIADVDFTIEEKEGVKEIHLSDVLYHLVLDKIRAQEKASLPPGKYTCRMTATIVGEEAPAEEEE